MKSIEYCIQILEITGIFILCRTFPKQFYGNKTNALQKLGFRDSSGYNIEDFHNYCLDIFTVLQLSRISWGILVTWYH